MLSYPPQFHTTGNDQPCSAATASASRSTGRTCVGVTKLAFAAPDFSRSRSSAASCSAEVRTVPRRSSENDQVSQLWQERLQPAIRIKPEGTSCGSSPYWTPAPASDSPSSSWQTPTG